MSGNNPGTGPDDGRPGQGPGDEEPGQGRGRPDLSRDPLRNAADAARENARRGRGQPNLDTRARGVEKGLREQYRDAIHRLPNVHGTAIGPKRVRGLSTGDLAIVVYVDQKVPDDDLDLGERVPDHVIVDGEAIPTDVQIAPRFRATAGEGSPLRREEIRPLVGGIEVGANGQSGTMSALLRTRSGEPRIITARHAVTESTGSTVGTEVSQPAGGEAIGEVTAGHRFTTSGSRRNRLDTVLIDPDDEDDVRGVYLGFREASDTGRAHLGDRLVTFGAAGLTSGEVTARGVATTVSLPWDDADEAEYSGLIEYDTGARDGMSGAMVARLNPATRELTLVGQHVGGSRSSSLMIPWVRIEREFGELFPADEDGSVVRTRARDDRDDEREQAELTIRTLDSDGNRLGNTDVQVGQVNYATDTGGELVVTLDAGTYDVTATRDGYESASQTITLDWADRESMDLVLVSVDEPADVTVAVENESGEWLTDATVEIDGVTQTANDNGETFWELDEGSYVVTADSGGYDPAEEFIEVSWGETKTVTMVLSASTEPALVDDFERTDIDPWTNQSDGLAEITTAAAIDGDGGLDVPPQCEVVALDGLENFPEAGGGPDNDGAFEFKTRWSESGGSTDLYRFEWAVPGDGSGDFLRFHFDGANNSITFRIGTTSELSFFVSVNLDSVIVVRVHEWRHDYIDIGLYTEGGTELDRQDKSFSSGTLPTEGGIRAWTNFTTGYHLDSIFLLGEVDGTPSVDTTTIEDFEHNDLTSFYDRGAGWQTTTDAALEGSYGLENAQGNTGNDLFSLPSDHPNYNSSAQPETLPRYPERGDQFAIDMVIVNDAFRRRFQYCMQDYSRSANGYRLEFDVDIADAGEVRVRMQYISGGSSTNMAWGDMPYSVGEQYTIGVTMTDPEGHYLEIVDSGGSTVLSLSNASESHYSSGGVGHWASSSNHTYADDWRIID